MADIPESLAIGVHNDDGDEVVGENAVGEGENAVGENAVGENAINGNALNENAQMEVQSAILYNMNDFHCKMCLSLPVPPVYHCAQGHFLCSNCHKSNCHGKDPKCPIKNCKMGTFECKLTSFLLGRMRMICPNKSCSSLPLPIKDFTSHVKECSLSHPQYNCSCSCPCCGAEYTDVPTLMDHLDDEHEPTEVINGEHITLMMVQGQKRILKVKSSSQTYLLLKFKEGAVSLHHMCWDEPIPHNLHVKGWSFIGLLTHDTQSDTVEQYLELPLILEEVTVKLQIGPSIAIAKPMAVLYLADLANVDDLPEDAAVKILVCRICQKVNPPVIHCTFGHTVCLVCCREKVKVDEELGRMDKCFECAYCTLQIMRCESGSCILEKSKYYCPNRSVGCQEVMPIARYEMHKENCLKPHCPICGERFNEILLLTNHLAEYADHRPKRVKYLDMNLFTVLRGRKLIVEEKTNHIFLLMFEDNHLCLQHMWWADPQEYVIEFDDLGCTWSFHGKTVAMERFPTMSAECLKIPKSVLHPKSSEPVLITLEIVHPKKCIRK